MKPQVDQVEDDELDIISRFESATENAGLVQTETLRRILELNHGVEYLKNWLGDIDIRDMEGGALESLYTSAVPLVTHADLEPYIQRIADGDTSPLLTKQPITTLSLSSGTTEGRQKYIPFTPHSAKTTLQLFRLAAAYRSRVYTTREGGKILEFIYNSKQLKTKGGLKAGTATGHYYSSQEFEIKQKQTKLFTCSPQEVISNGDYKETTYCHLLLGLFFSGEIEFITSAFAYTIVQALRSFEDHWRELCSDLRLGRLSPRITSARTRKAILETVSPNPCLASRIESCCEELEGNDWFGMIPRLWPTAKYVYSIMTGSMQPYLKRLRHYAGELPLVGADYGATEGWIGVNVEPRSSPENVCFAVVPTFAYFEFVPLYRREINGRDCCSPDAAGDDFVEDSPVPLTGVKVGQEYEIVLTTFTGLYRYRLGDVVEVVGFYKGTPKLNYICRRKLILTINIDKTTENDLQLVVEKGSKLLTKARAELVDFTSHADIATQPGHYIIYWEIKGEVEESVLRDCCREMDGSFADHGYVVARRTQCIGPLELRVVEPGTFRKVMEYFIGNGSALSQFKTPRCTSNQVLLRILNVCTIKRFHSMAYG